MQLVYRSYVVLPSEEVPKKILENSKFLLYFNDYVGTLDRSYIVTYIEGLYNFINKTNRTYASKDLTKEDLDEVKDKDNNYKTTLVEGGGLIIINALRERIANNM
ncbi:hypothetical protein M438DRAFT_357589 [Aureobasidium pullulans EXF-150]|uniref:Uncharacterized protein n=1 Tax=Aureobasidium pullulans EXF-150 TaxID=1043002 RepID=A0A074XEF1_AURPU|nr:uncharacterized protein M438DRAFT_357589 [Aureobasidium pullulans EXF-150]KEQ82089.1 hypothetical protein M438DRAFT_357589 [Aureobasidium pullulans EXF-150]